MSYQCLNEFIDFGVGKALRHHNIIMIKLVGIFYYVGSGSGLICAEKSDPDRIRTI
jgi:hypothetical protein